ncbi:hypothetical protein ANCDUO_07057 [Ancylostoma duodenale]|uniref:Cytochrome b561 domain-containing protein n=1 Tax=Ancylostoma duodenale TaxID=51022 RepID=A0A0C2D005_9BILA|nr:hypothetical protein ANCDUO_07057 [Ancylostoma duodenale]
MDSSNLCIQIAALGQSLLVFRVERVKEKRKAYMKHVGFACASGLLMIVGILVRYARPKPHAAFYSVHPWIGLFTVMLCLIEPGIIKKMKEAALPCHILFGFGMFGMAFVSVCFGTAQRSTSRWKREQEETLDVDLDEVTAPDLALNDADLKLGNSIIMQGSRETQSL